MHMRSATGNPNGATASDKVPVPDNSIEGRRSKIAIFNVSISREIRISREITQAGKRAFWWFWVV
jgi:hypothetical protein